MFNLWWGVLFIAANFVAFLACYKWFGRTGLYAWTGFATVLANIQVVKTIELPAVAIGGAVLIPVIVMTLGNTIYTSIYMATDLLNEKYGHQEAKRAVWFGFFTLICSTIMMQMVLAFKPAEQGIDGVQGAMELLFGLLPQLAVASLSAYFISQFLDVKLFSKLRGKFPARNQFWIRINVSAVISQFIDSLVFCTIAFATEYPWEVWWQILLTTYVFKYIIAAISTPVLYLARSMDSRD